MKGDVNLRFIGSKSNLINEIDKIVKKNIYGDEETFLDLFAGTNIVGEYFKKDFTIYSNDILYFSYVNAKAVIENNGNLTFSKLKLAGIDSPLDYLQENAERYIQNSVVGYYEQNYTPTGGAMYLTVQNGKRIDYIRDKIDIWKTEKLITDSEFYYLLSSLIESIPFVSNTTGTYGAYLKHWDKRALKSLELIPLVVQDNKKENKAYNEDANILINNKKVDIAYIDTPYNNRQYASNYHLLENIAKNDKPELNGKTKIFEWSNLKSDYSIKRKALTAMKDLLNNLQAKHIILSYNNEGIIPEDELISLMKENSFDGTVQIERIPYRKYKSKRPSKSDELYEILIYVQKEAITNKKSKSKYIAKSKPNKWIGEKQRLIKSPLNYIGGKFKLLKQILPLFPSEIDTFVDLFSGGANVGINVEAKHYIFNDMNNRINEMFRYFAKQEVEDLIGSIRKRIAEYDLTKENEEGYLEFRNQYNKNPNPLDLYVLVSFSYNYQFRFNNSMEFNNPFGRNRSRFSDNMEKNLRLFVNKLHEVDAEFTDEFFNELDLSCLGEKDFVYLDPPYLITTGNYNDGNRGFVNWGIEQERDMYKLMDKLSRQGVRYALSNVIEHKGKKNELLKEYINTSNVRVHYLEYNYNNSSHNSKGTGSTEVLITNYETSNFDLLTDRTGSIRKIASS